MLYALNQFNLYDIQGVNMINSLNVGFNKNCKINVAYGRYQRTPFSFPNAAMYGPLD